jgi:hypothetical protein
MTDDGEKTGTIRYGTLRYATLRYGTVRTVLFLYLSTTTNNQQRKKKVIFGTKIFVFRHYLTIEPVEASLTAPTERGSSYGKLPGEVTYTSSIDYVPLCADKTKLL